MKSFFTIALLLCSLPSFAEDLCSRYYQNERYMKGIEFLAQYQGLLKKEFCNLPQVLDLEVQPSRIITREGEVIPHLRIQQHYEYDSCLFMVNETDYSLTSSKCYSGT